MEPHLERGGPQKFAIAVNHITWPVAATLVPAAVVAVVVAALVPAAVVAVVVAALVPAAVVAVVVAAVVAVVVAALVPAAVAVVVVVCLWTSTTTPHTQALMRKWKPSGP